MLRKRSRRARRADQGLAAVTEERPTVAESSTAPAQPSANCAESLAREFSVTETASDIAACLAGAADVETRDVGSWKAFRGTPPARRLPVPLPVRFLSDTTNSGRDMELRFWYK